VLISMPATVVEGRTSPSKWDYHLQTVRPIALK
jgi:hypothetical protein